MPSGACVFAPPFDPPDALDALGARVALDQGGFSNDASCLATPVPVPAGVQRFLVRPPARGDLPVVLVNLSGRRYVDESASYPEIAWCTAQQEEGSGFVLFDDAVYQQERFVLERAESWGARIVRADDLPTLARRLSEWDRTPSRSRGVDPLVVQETVGRFNAAVLAGQSACDALHPPRRGNRVPLTAPPFYAAEVVRAVVDGVGGVRIDAQARVLDAAGSPVPGLFAAGADAGRPYDLEHGGLGHALVTGRVAGAQAAAYLGRTPTPHEGAAQSRPSGW
jgi:succinate dehydrogenase/fumarate reductase flavoprotein subunit